MAAGEVIGGELEELSASVLVLSRGCKKDYTKHEEGNEQLAFEVGCQNKRTRKMSKHKLTAA